VKNFKIKHTFIASVAAVVVPSMALAQSNPSVIVTVENIQPARGTFLTPPWLGIHDGSFDIYDRNQASTIPLGGNEVEALAEDGNNGPITAAFERLAPYSPQISALPGPAGPLAPGNSASVTFNVDPSTDRFFSYASMIIPSNDFFIANGNPQAHPLFNRRGRFIGQDFVVAGSQVLDAGTEVNDEIASNVAFLGQAAPNTGSTEGGVITAPVDGFAPRGALSFPNGVLNHPVFGNGDFTDDGVFRVSFRYVDLGGVVKFRSRLNASSEVGAPVVSRGRGTLGAVSIGGKVVKVAAEARRLTGPIVAAHLHLGAAGANGPVIVDLTNRVNGNRLKAGISAADLTSAFDGDFGDFLNELAAGNVYINLHTEAFPAGEIRGQVRITRNAPFFSRFDD